MRWSRYEDVKAVWHLFSHIEMKYNVLILNASDRINRNDLRFFPEEFSAKPPLHPSTLTHTRSHTHPCTRSCMHAPRLCCNCLGWGVESWRTHSSKSLVQKCYLCSVETVSSCGRKTGPSLSVCRVFGSERKCNNVPHVAVVFPGDTIWA